MSAFLAFTYPDKVEVVADGATCLPSGHLIAKTDKIKASPHRPLAVVGRGRHVELEQLADYIIGLTAEHSVDETIGILAAALDQGVFVEGQYPYEVAICCWSETEGPKKYIFTSLPRPESPIGPIEAFRLYWWDAPLGGGAHVELEDLPGVTQDDFAETIRDVAVPVFEAMRRRSRDEAWKGNNVNPEAYWVGGHLDFAVIDKDGVRIERIHEWPDEILKMIEVAA